MKNYKAIFWITTGFIFLFEGVMPALTGHSELAKTSILHLGYPEYFVTILVVFKVIGSVVIILPQVPGRLKEWAYTGLALEMICACTSIWVVDGFSAMTVFPLVILAVLVGSYLSYHAQVLEAP